MSNVAVLSPKSLFRAGLATLLKTLGFEHVDQAATLIELKERTPSGSKPEILLVDLTSEIETVSCFMDDIKAWLPETKVVLLAETLDIGRLGECFAAGASGYLLEDLSGEALEKSLTLVSAGEKVFPSELALRIGDLAAQHNQMGRSDKLEDLHLSRREIEILGLLASGQSNKAIAAELAVAESTVKVHLRRILRKIHAGNRTQAALWAWRSGMVGSGLPTLRLAGTDTAQDDPK